MTPAEIATVAVRVLRDARNLIAAMPAHPFHGSALQAISSAAWVGEQAVSVRASNRRRWAVKALAQAVPTDLTAWDSDLTVTQNDVLAAFDSAIQMTAA